MQQCAYTNGELLYPNLGVCSQILVQWLSQWPLVNTHLMLLNS